MDQKNEPVNATGHDWQAVAATAATCQSAKVVTYKCSTCNDTKTETEGSKIDHSWVLTYSEPATCAADGYNSYKCGMCSETKTDVLPATEQCSWGDWIVAIEATCTKDGLKVAQCSVCGDTKKETIPSEGVHDYRTQSSQAATCTQDGYKKYECSKCHKEKTETLKATGHNLGTATVITAATCTAEGKSEATCKTCGAKETSTIPKTAHSWGDWKVTKEATEAATGTKERTCKTCGAKDTETIPKKGAKPTATPKPTKKPSSSDKWEVTTTEYYVVRRAGSMHFENIPVDGSEKMDDKITESLEPYDLTKAVPFQPTVLSGAMADHADVDAVECETRAILRVENSMIHSLRNTVTGYDSVRVRSKNISSTGGKVTPVLMPVWLITTKKEDKVYTFAINGQTGQLTCNVPTDKGKAFLWGAGAFTGVFGMAALVLYLLKMLGSGTLLIAGIAALIAALVVVGVLIGQLKQASSKSSAEGYSSGGCKLDVEYDHYLYSKTTRRKIETQNKEASA